MDNKESKINVNIKDKASSLVIVELLKAQAHTRALATMLLKKEELSEYHELVSQEVELLTKTFLEENRNQLSW